MGSLSAVAALQLPVRLRASSSEQAGERLGRPVDVLLDTHAWRALGFVVLCADESVRFLPFAASQPGDDEIAVASALLLLEDVGFYRSRTSSLRALLGGRVERSGRTAGILRDLVLGPSGEVTELELGRRGSLLRVPAAGSAVGPHRADAA
ncbi:MAG TPA: hypothetical protein VMT74_01985 [Gaiellaceae bacterium]|nr:hypothetical protein [Gaiellaceae bacterium]